MAAPSPAKAELSPAEAELRGMWQDAENDFRQMTRKNLRADPEKRLEDVLQELERKYQPETPEGRSTKAKISETIGKVLSCVQLLGGLAAQGASIVFGPATLCFNAISFLIDVPGKIASVYEGVGNLFEEISHFLVLFRIYGNYTKLDPDLRDGTHKLMVSLVRICGLSIKIIDGGVLHHIKIGAKVTFLNDDSGVKSELTKFKALIEKQSRVTEATTLQHVLANEKNTVEILKSQFLASEKLKGVETGVNVLVADMNDRKLERITSERVEAIAKKLSMTGESVQEAKVALQTMRASRLEGSSQWLLSHPDYKEWITPDTESIPLLLLSGDTKTGRSFLLAFIEEDLRKINADIAIAYHAFAGRDVKSAKDKGKDDVVSALKSMALQVASQNKTYAKDMVGLKDSDFKPLETHKESWERQWWDKLQFSKYFQSKEDVSVVLMFDGLDELSESSASKLLGLLREESRSSAKADRVRLRILATGKKETFENQPANINNIQIANHNEPDIKLYIERELNKDEVLQGQHVEMLDLLQSIRKKLPEVADGSFSIVQQKLARIREAVESDAYSDDVETILDENPAEDLDKIAQKVISDLNATLNAHDIKQLNELLNWVIFGYEYFSIDQLRAALFLNSGRLPLQPFEKKLKSKYARVFDLSSDQVEVDEYIGNLFQSSENPTPGKAVVPDIDGAKITMTVSINQADLRTVQQFCWDLTERVGIGRFDFFAANSKNESKGVIHCDEVNAHYHMAEQLLKLLNDEPHEKTKPLVEYALMYLPRHLQTVKEALDEGKLGVSARKAIAKRLIDLLSDIEGIEKYWNTISSVYSYWAGDEEVEMIRDWLTDSRTIAELEPKERRWVRQHTAKSEGKGGFYKPITLMMARRWLQDRSWDAHDTYEWIDGFIQLQKSKDDDGGNDKPGDENLDKPPESSVDAPESSNAPAPVPNGDIPPPSAGPPSTVPPSEGHSDNESTSEVPEHKKILAAATWVRQALNIKEENSLWYERIGQACYLAGEYKAAIEWFDKAKSLPDCHWTVNEGQALAYAELAELEDGSHKESACREMEVVLTVLRSLKKDGRLADDDREALVRNLKKLASWQEELSATSRAFALYEEVLEVDPHEYRTCCDLLRALYEQNREEEARNMLIRIKNQPGKLKSLNQFSELLQHLASNEDDNDDLNIIVTLAQTDTTFCQHTLEAFQSAIDDARRTNQTINQGVLLLYQGIVLARGATDDTRLQQAAYSWEDCQSLYLASRYDLMETRRLAARYVTQYHFYQAIKHGDSSQESEQHFNKLLKISRIANTWTHGFRPASYIASYYVHRDQPEEARKLFMEEMVDALDILSNRDPDDDFYGYKLLANILMYTGDDLNALSAWSLLGPSDTYLSSNPGSLSNDDKAVVNSVEETPTLPPPSEPDAEESTRDRDGPLTYVCDGRCDSTWSYANDMYICRYCPDTQFTSDCLEKLKSNKLQRFICDPNHSWLHVPVWSDKEALEVGKGNVRVYGELVDGKRVGGKIVDVHEWLDEIREKWGIPKKLGGLESEAVATVA